MQVRIGVLTGEECEIRKICSSMNYIVVISVNTKLVVWCRGATWFGLNRNPNRLVGLVWFD